MSYRNMITLALALCACVALISAAPGHSSYSSHGGSGYGGGHGGGSSYGGGYGGHGGGGGYGGHGGGSGYGDGYDDGYGSFKYGYYGPYGDSYVHVDVDGWQENSQYGFKAGGY